MICLVHNWYKLNFFYRFILCFQGFKLVVVQSIIGATLKRREGSGRVVSGFEPGFAVISFNVFVTELRRSARYDSPIRDKARQGRHSTTDPSHRARRPQE